MVASMIVIHVCSLVANRGEKTFERKTTFKLQAASFVSLTPCRQDLILSVRSPLLPPP